MEGSVLPGRFVGLPPAAGTVNDPWLRSHSCRNRPTRRESIWLAVQPALNSDRKTASLSGRSGQLSPVGVDTQKLICDRNCDCTNSLGTPLSRRPGCLPQTSLPAGRHSRLEVRILIQALVALFLMCPEW